MVPDGIARWFWDTKGTKVSHLRRGNKGGVIQEAAFGQGTLIGAQGV